MSAHCSSGDRLPAPSLLSEAPLNDDLKFVIVAHSMGGLVICVALADGILNPGWIDQVFFVGTPFKGAPKAFGQLFGKVDLPGLKFWTRLRSPRNSNLLLRMFHDAVKEFSSAYELLPHKEWSYLECNDEPGLGNALFGRGIEQKWQELALNTHEKVIRGARILRSGRIPIHVAFSGLYTKNRTEIQYRASFNQNQRYTVNKILKRTKEGDGTVPRSSAAAFPNAKKRELREFVFIEHMLLCNNSRISSWIDAQLDMGLVQ